MMPSRATMMAGLAAWLAFAPAARGAEIPGEIREACIRNVVRVEVGTSRGTITGSGTLIGARGFILTNFHVVGHTSYRTGFPGSFHSDEFRIALTRDEHEAVVDQYLAEVVRGSVELDLALLRIVRPLAEGEEMPESFPVMEQAVEPSLGTAVWALGFPDGLRTINLTAGQVAGFEKNSAGEVSWFRTDTEFNPGNSGGALVDAQCRLVAVPTAISSSVEPIEFARPASRIPAEWLVAMDSPDVEAQPAEGIPPLTAVTEFVDRYSGDSAGAGGGVRYYAVPRDRPGVLTVSPRLSCGLIGSGGQVIRRGDGQIMVTNSDPPQTLLAVFIPRSSAGEVPEVRVGYRPMTVKPGVEVEGAAYIDGRVDGGDCSLWVALGAEGDDLAALRSRLAYGEITEAEFRAALSALVPVKDDGTFRLPLLPGPHRLGIIGPSGIDERAIDVAGDATSLGDFPAPDVCGTDD
ncbi:MAG: trypsin-like peptidase domain-containing protein [Deltaproteobacteria bacterium]|nr:trypsin-like peptidase domain-containing protein [Deltaproteobacteria bacterium]